MEGNGYTQQYQDMTQPPQILSAVLYLRMDEDDEWGGSLEGLEGFADLRVRA